MSNNAFATSSSHQEPSVSSPEPIHVENSYEKKNSGGLLAFSHEHIFLFGGGIVLFLGLLFVMVSHFGNTDMKASLANQAPTETYTEVQKDNKEVEIVYKDQYGNILTNEQAQNILNPKKTETVVVNTENTTRAEGSSQQGVQTNTNNISAENSGNEVVYPEISPESVEVDSTKDTLYVKQDDAEKLLAQNRLVKKVVDNRPIYVEPITGAVVELIQAIERPRAERFSGSRPGALSTKGFPEFLKKSSSEATRVNTSSQEITRTTYISSAELGR